MATDSMAAATIHDNVREYYGKVLQTSKDLKTNACCDPQAVEPRIRKALARVHPEVLERFYGCGSPLPSALQGCSVLDLGCGVGRDCYALSLLVGEAGNVVGVDMTEEQLAMAERHQEYHRIEFGHSRSNVSFRQGYIEDLNALGLKDDSFDVVVSNCVINLSPDKRQVFSEIFRVLKPGGELYFSDIFSTRRIPSDLALDPVLRGECLGGALYIEDFRRMLTSLGCPDFRVTASRRLELRSEEIKNKVGSIEFLSLTIRAFKLPSLEDRCEDYGQVAFYRGTLDEAPHVFHLDDHHAFETDTPVLVCGNTASMLSETRYARHFRVDGNRNRHRGLFRCEAPSPGGNAPEPVSCC